jgi:hypothetical protein
MSRLVFLINISLAIAGFPARSVVSKNRDIVTEMHDFSAIVPGTNDASRDLGSLRGLTENIRDMDVTVSSESVVPNISKELHVSTSADAQADSSLILSNTQSAEKVVSEDSRTSPSVHGWIDPPEPRIEHPVKAEVVKFTSASGVDKSFMEPHLDNKGAVRNLSRPTRRKNGHDVPCTPSPNE